MAKTRTKNPSKHLKLQWLVDDGKAALLPFDGPVVARCPKKGGPDQLSLLSCCGCTFYRGTVNGCVVCGHMYSRAEGARLIREAEERFAAKQPGTQATLL